MTEKEIEEKANEIRKDEVARLLFCADVGITEDEFFVNRNGDFEIEDMVRAFERGKQSRDCNCMTYLNFKDLEKENAELKADNDARKFAMAMSEKVEKLLREENAELKRENRGIKTCANCDEYVIGRCCNYPNGVCHHWKLSEKYRNDDQLTKAKEIIKNLLSAYTTYADSFDDRDNEIVEEVGQFISEVEK